MHTHLILLALISSVYAEVFTFQLFVQSDNAIIDGFSVVAVSNPANFQSGQSSNLLISNTSSVATILAYDTNTNLVLYQMTGETYCLNTKNDTLYGISMSNTNDNITSMDLNPTTNVFSVIANNASVAESLGFNNTSTFISDLNFYNNYGNVYNFIVNVGTGGEADYSFSNFVKYSLVYKRLSQNLLATSGVALLTDPGTSSAVATSSAVGIVTAGSGPSSRASVSPTTSANTKNEGAALAASRVTFGLASLLLALL